MWQALGLAWELGYTIALPLVALALAGRLLDNWLKTSPWFLLTGVLLSIIITIWLIYRKTKLIVTDGLSANVKNKENKL
jgi:F0F1-type ATP synthase assembly protein I